MTIRKVDYEIIDKIVISIFLDYGINKFPIEIFKLCEKMGVKLVKYSSFNNETIILLLKFSKDGFYYNTSTGPAIFFNDINNGEARIRMTIAHELKHYVCEDKGNDENSEKLADHFARYLLCPTPYLIYFKYTDLVKIANDFNISLDASNNALKNIETRRKYYNEKIFDYEQPLIDLFI